MTFFYVILAFIIGLLLGWYLWGRLRGEIDSLRGNLESTRSERDRLKADTSRLTGELETCSSARADLQRQLGQSKASAAPAALMSAPAVVTSTSPAAPKKATAPATARPAKTSATKSASAPKKTAGVAKATEAATKAPKPAKAAKPAAPTKKDNLRRLVGIGPVNERKLNQHGITTFAQIAGWTAADIKKIEEYLEFDGRIEREQWIAQAKLLAAGNEKEFARSFPSAGSSKNT